MFKVDISENRLVRLEKKRFAALNFRERDHLQEWVVGMPSELRDGIRHICWDGCMFPNAVLEDQETWNRVLGAMEAVRRGLLRMTTVQVSGSTIRTRRATDL